MPKLFGRSLDEAELASFAAEPSGLFGVELTTLADGPERGVRVLRLRSGGGLTADVLLDRGMDVGGLELFGIPIGWRSPTGFRSPWLHEHDAEHGLGWLRSFSGLVATCGLDHVMGPASEDAGHFGYPYRRTVSHGLHGRIAYEPARLMGAGARDDGGRRVLWAEGEVRQAAMFGEFLVLTRRIEVEVGGTRIIVRDRVENRGFRPTPHALLYHVNVGWPVLDAGTRLVAPIRRTRTYVHDPRASDVGALEQSGPRADFGEQVYEHELSAADDGTTLAALINPAFRHPLGAKGLGLAVGFDTGAMPGFWQWQNLARGDYVVGLEPATITAGSRDDWRAKGELKLLEHGDACDYRLTLEPVLGEADLARLESEVTRLLT